MAARHRRGAAQGGNRERHPMKPPRWLVPFLLAAVLGWWISRPTGPAFVRLPGSGFPAPSWQMPDLNGHPVSSAEYQGKILVLNFWATWCPPCRRELPELNAFHQERLAQGVVVIGAATDDRGAEVVAPFAQRNRLTYPILIADTNIQQTFAITTLPTTLVIGRDGRVAARYLGSLTAAELNRAVAPLLGSGASTNR